MVNVAADKLFAEYGASHRNSVNKAIHWLAVPVIFFSVVRLLSAVPFGLVYVVAAFAMAYYVSLSPRLSVGMGLFMALCLFLATSVTLVQAVVAFVVAWIFQFIGHSSLFENKKPSFFKDLFFLLVGPAWLMHFVYKRLGIAY